MTFKHKGRTFYYVFTTIDYKTIKSELIDPTTGEVISMELKSTQDAYEYMHVLRVLGYDEIN